MVAIEKTQKVPVYWGQIGLGGIHGLFVNPLPTNRSEKEFICEIDQMRLCEVIVKANTVDWQKTHGSADRFERMLAYLIEDCLDVVPTQVGKDKVLLAYQNMRDHKFLIGHLWKVLDLNLSEQDMIFAKMFVGIFHICMDMMYARFLFNDAHVFLNAA